MFTTILVYTLVLFTPTGEPAIRQGFGPDSQACHIAAEKLQQSKIKAACEAAQRRLAKG